MLNAIFTLLPNFAVHVISFVARTVWWISHHTFIHDLLSVDRKLLWLNSLFLMLISFIPFSHRPSGLIIPGQPIATSFYGLVCTLIGCSLWLMRWYASMYGEKLMKPEIPREALLRRVRISLLSPVLYLAGATVSLLYPIFALILYAAIPAYFAFGNLGHAGSKKAPVGDSIDDPDD